MQVRMHISKKISDLIHLDIRRSKKFRGRCVVINNSDWEDFKSHQRFQIFFCFLVAERFRKLSDGVVVFVGKLPPVWAELRDLINAVFLETITQNVKLIINCDQIGQIQGCVFTYQVTRVVFIVFLR